MKINIKQHLNHTLKWNQFWIEILTTLMLVYKTFSQCWSIRGNHKVHLWMDGKNNTEWKCYRPPSLHKEFIDSYWLVWVTLRQIAPQFKPSTELKTNSTKQNKIIQLGKILSINKTKHLKRSMCVLLPKQGEAFKTNIHTRHISTRGRCSTVEHFFQTVKKHYLAPII